MATVSERTARARQLAWPLSLPFAPASSVTPDFAHLTALYCNHLAYALARAGASGTAPGIARPLTTEEKSFIAYAASCYAREWPAATNREVALAQLAAALTRAMEAGNAATPDGEAPASAITAFAQNDPGSGDADLARTLCLLPGMQAANEAADSAAADLYRRFTASR